MRRLWELLQKGVQNRVPEAVGAGEEPGRAHDLGGICLWPGEELAATQYPLHSSALVGPQGTQLCRDPAVGVRNAEEA